MRPTPAMRRIGLWLAAITLAGGLLASLQAQVPSAPAPAPPPVATQPAEPAEPPPPPLHTRVYDVRDLVADVPNFDHAPDLLPQQRSAKDVHTDGLFAGSATGGGGLFLVPRGRGGWETRDRGEEYIEDLIRLIQEVVSPDTWRDNGGTCALRQMGGQLIVTQTADNHAALKDLLAQLRETKHINLRIRAHWVLANRPDLEPSLKPVASDRRPTTGPFAAAPPSRSPALLGISAADLAALPNLTTIYRAETTCQNGQRVAAFAVKGRTPSGKVSVVATPDAAQVEADAGPTFDGLVLDATTVLSEDRKRAILTLRGQWAESADEQGAPGVTTVRATTATRPVGSAAPLGGLTNPTGGAIDATVTAPRRTARVSDLRTTLSIPLGQWIYVGGSTLNPTPAPDGGKQPHTPPQLYLFIEVTAD